MRWTFSNMCAAAGEIEIRLRDDTHGGGWPAAGKVYLLAPNATSSVDITCVPGAKICFGGRGRSASLVWGADTDFTRGCMGCCHPCGENPPIQDLICN